MRTRYNFLCKPVATIVLLLLFCAACAAGVSMWQDTQQEKAASTNASAHVLQALEPVLQNEGQGNFSEIVTVLQQCVWEKGLAYVLISDVHGNIIAHSFFSRVPPSIAQKLPSSDIKKREGTHVLTVPSELPLHSKLLHSITKIPNQKAYVLHVGITNPVQERGFFALFAAYAAQCIAGFFLCAVGALAVFPALRRRVCQGSLPDATRRAEDARKHAAEQETIPGNDCSATAARSLGEALAPSVASMTEGFLLFDASGEILMCNTAMMRSFGIMQSPVGLQFTDVFNRESVLHAVSPASMYSEKFLNALRTVSTQVSTEITLGAGDEKVVYYVVILCFMLQGGKVTACFLKNTHEFSFHHDAYEPVADPQCVALYDENRELARKNAQLRIENAERSAVAQALRRAESRYRDIFDNAMEGIFQWSPDWRLISANMAFARMLGYSTVNALVDVAETAFFFCLKPVVEAEFIAELEIRGSVSNFEMEIIRQDESSVWASINARRAMSANGETEYYEAFIENIANRKNVEAKLVYQAFHDPLTGLANRALFHDRLSMALHRAKRQPEYAFAVLYLDLDRFKVVNDSFGHSTGDAVLCHAAMSILSCVRNVDTVARFGGDEFAVLIDDAEHSPLAIRVAKRIHATLSKPFTIDGQEISIGGSIGIVLHAEKYELPEDILRDADTAMYRAKAAHGTSIKVFSQRLREEIVKNISFENDLRQALKNEEFFLEYQPIVAMNSGVLYGFEAMLRWNRKGEIVPADVFIPVAEEIALVHTLGLFAIEAVCRQIVAWKQKCSLSFAVHLSISGRQLVFPGFSTSVHKIVQETGLPPEYLLFSITEGVLLQNASASITVIQQLREMGIDFCLDGFGAGLSSLSYLRQLPLDCVKVDKSLVADIETDKHSFALVRNLVALGRDFTFAVIVDGVARQEQLDVLKTTTCPFIQGAVFYPPLLPAEAVKLLR